MKYEKPRQTSVTGLQLLSNRCCRVGLPDPYPTPEDRAAIFASIDENGDGSVSADEWLVFCSKEIIARGK